MNTKHTPGPHSHLTIGVQVQAIAAERDKLEEINAELLEALIVCERVLAENGLPRTASIARAAIAKATGSEA